MSFSLKTRLWTKGLFDPDEVCVYRSQTVYCAAELCLSVDKREKTTNKEGTTLEYNVYVMYILSRVKNWEYLHPAQQQTLVSCHHLSAVFVRSIRNIHVRTTISHIQMFRKVLRCVIPTSVAHLANINRQPVHLCVKRFSKSVLLVSVTSHSSSECEWSRSEATQ